MGNQPPSRKGERHGIHRFSGVKGTTWRAIIELSPDPMTGARRQKRLSGYVTRRDLEREIARILARDERGNGAVDDKAPVADVIAEWLAQIERTRDIGTYREYERHWRLWIKPVIGGLPIRKVAAAHIRRIQAKAQDAGRSDTTVGHIHGTIRAALNYAVDVGYIETSPCRSVSPPPRDTEEMHPLNVEQSLAFIAAAEGDEYQTLFRIAIITGMRRGELLGLRWSDVDLDNGAIAIRQAITRGKKSRWEVGTLKTKKSRRPISLRPVDVEELRGHLQRQRLAQMAAAEWENTGLVFTGTSGKAVRPNNLDRRYKRLLAKAELPEIRFHDLRHTMATLMLAAGINPLIVSQRLGHSKVSITLDLYSHVIPGLQEAAVQTLDDFLARPRDTSVTHVGIEAENTRELPGILQLGAG